MLDPDAANFVGNNSFKKYRTSLKLSFRNLPKVSDDLKQANNYASLAMVQTHFDEILQRSHQQPSLLCKITKQKDKAMMQFDILQFNNSFFEALPLGDKEYERNRVKSVAVKRSMLRKPITQQSSTLFKSSAVVHLDPANGVNKNQIVDQLSWHIFRPHLISNSTKLSFQEHFDNKELLSLMDIMRVFNKSQNQISTYYFKYDASEI